MPVFDYTALNDRGKPASGIIDAESAYAARQKLRAAKIYPVSLKEVGTESFPSKPAKTAQGITARLWRPRAGDIAMITRQLATLTGAGFPVVSALEAVIRQTRSPRFRKHLAQIKALVVEGNTVAQALSCYPHIFSPLYINLVHSGETSGTLEIVLARLADIAEAQVELSNRIKSALIYPVVMALVGTAVLSFLLIFIVPSITSIFADMGRALPAPTRLLLHISALFSKYGWALIPAAAAMAWGWHAVRQNPRTDAFLDGWILKLPVIGPLARRLEVARFTRTLGSLLENGIPLLSALEIAKNVVGNRSIAETVDQAAGRVNQGQGIGDSLELGGRFPSLSIQMIQVGEQSGKLEAMLKKTAEVYEKEAETIIMRLTTLMDPLMILIMGALVGFIVLSICLPIFDMNQLIR